MVVPGLHSIFSGFQLGFGATGLDRGLAWRVAQADPRFRLVALDVTGAGFAGTLRAFARLPPVEAPSLAAIAALVDPGEFAGRRALVIGGSRGLGAVTAKLIAAGGGEVTVSYLRGRDEAEAIAREIDARFGPGRCRILRYDTARRPGAAARGDRRTHHPRLLLRHRPDLRARLRRRLRPGEVRGLRPTSTSPPSTGWRSTSWRVSPDGLALFYPSSVAVEKRPKGITEYAMAKAAGEILCADLAQSHRRLRIAAPRLPRIMTDQTATVPPVPAADPVETMLALLRARIGRHRLAR